MGRQLDAIRFGFPWGKALAIAMLVLAVVYASQHPHSFIYYLVKVIIAPVP